MTLDHRTRAAAALKAIRSFKGDDAERKKYTSRIKDLGLMIRQNNLLHALVYLRTKKNDGGAEIAEQVGKHLQDHDFVEGDVLKALGVADERSYLRAQNEAMAYAIWLKRFAVAEFGEEHESDRP